MDNSQIENLINNIQDINNTSNLLTNNEKNNKDETLNNSIESSKINELLEDLINSNTNEETDKKKVSEDTSNTFDFELILNLINILNSMQSLDNNPKAKLLMDLKPFLKESRQKKIDKYIELTNLIDIFTLLGGDINNAK